VTAAALALLALWAVYALLTALRIGLAFRFLARDPAADGASAPAAPPAGAGGPITVMQPILSGDPTLARNLEENLRHHPAAHFLWLIDEDDAPARELAARLQAEHRERPGRLEVLVVPPPPQGRNPKVFKLALGLPRTAVRVAVLDDDTVLPPGALARASRALERGDLATGLPCYRAEGSFWSRLVAAFVNANTLVTYLPILAFRAPVTINGMFYLTRRATLERLGGFAAIEGKLCDDYELAKLYRAAGLAIVQTAVIHPISTTVRGAADYARILRRWMVFANHLFRESLDPAMVVLVVLPALLPLALAVLAGFAGPLAFAATLAGLLAKAAAMAAVRRRATGWPEGLSAWPFELLADMLQPFHAVTALFRPRRLRWRKRSIRLEDDGAVRYR
jgi:ceramide glucosyltransferase